MPTVLLLSAPRREDVLYRDELVEMDRFLDTGHFALETHSAEIAGG